MTSIWKKHKAACVAFLCFLFVYIGGILIFSMITLPNTFVNGQNRSYESKEGIFSYREPDRSIRFLGRAGEDFSIRESQISFSRKIEGNPELKQNLWLWPVAFFRRDEYVITYSVHYDESKLDFALLESPLQAEGTLPRDARLEIHDDGATIIPEEEGTRIVPEKAKARIVEAFTNGETEVRLDDIYIEPAVRKDDPRLIAEKAQVDEILQSQVHFDFGDRKYSLSGTSLLDVYELSESGEYVLNDSRLGDWVASVARETDTYGTVRQFQATGIGTVEVLPGIYGWQIDVKGTVEKIKEGLKEKKNLMLDPAYYHYGYDRRANDIGGTYLEVDLSRQHLWAYKDGALFLETPIVTGVPNEKFATPVGVNCIWSRERNQVLRGERAGDSERPEYETPVKYWMPIDWTGIGLHDADWRSDFGGDIYLNAGSHGCINLPPPMAEQIFENFEVLTPVVVYESSTSYSPGTRY